MKEMPMSDISNSNNEELKKDLIDNLKSYKWSAKNYENASECEDHYENLKNIISKMGSIEEAWQIWHSLKPEVEHEPFWSYADFPFESEYRKKIVPELKQSYNNNVLFPSVSPGQNEIRRIIEHFSPGYDYKKNSCSYNLYNILQTAFKNNHIITSDTITGRSLSTTDYSESYMDWIKHNSKTRELKKEFPRIRIDNFDYYYGSKNYEPAYFGGEHSQHTYSCLFQIHLTGKLYNSPGWYIDYYPNELYCKATNGVHRTLAHMLLGNPDLNVSRMNLFISDRTVQDPDLNRALLEFDKYFEHPGIAIKKYRFLTFSDSEVTAIKDFYYNTTFKEKEIIRRFIIKDDFRNLYTRVRINNQNVFYLEKIRRVIRYVYDRPIERSFGDKVKRFLTRQGFEDAEFKRDKYLIKKIEKLISDYEIESSIGRCPYCSNSINNLYYCNQCGNYFSIHEVDDLLSKYDKFNNNMKTNDLNKQKNKTV